MPQLVGDFMLPASDTVNGVLQFLLDLRTRGAQPFVLDHVRRQRGTAPLRTL
jgi:hypothetical protein